MDVPGTALLLLLCVSYHVYAEVTQADINNMAENLKLQLTIVDNLEYNGGKHKFRLTMTNNGSIPIKGDNWVIYFYSFFMLEHEHLPNPAGYEVPGQNIRLNHVTGGLFSLQPTPSFPEVKFNESHNFEFHGQNWAVSRSDVPPNWYISSNSSNSLEPKVLSSTAYGSRFVQDFTSARQWKRYRNDKYNPFSARDRYERYGFRKDVLGKNVIPTPKEINMVSGVYVDVGSDWTVTADNGAEREAMFIAGFLNLTYNNSALTGSKTVSLHLSPSDLSAEGYELVVNTTLQIVSITSSNTSGLFYGCQTLLSLMHDGKNRSLPEAAIKDEPRYGFRGMHIDVARNFHNKEDIIRLLDAMAKYKLNKLHLHLTDDEGWRLEIPGLPELTNIGGKRCHDLSERTCLLPQLGSGPDTSTSGSGYLSIKDYMDIVKHANDLHIEVIPEIDTPGHARAAIVAMENRYRNYSGSDMDKAKEFRLEDPNDNSTYFSIQMFPDNAINPCVNSTYKFMDKVITELKKAHKQAGQELRIFHFGGDEVAAGAWLSSEACKELIAALPPSTDPKFLKRYFVERVFEIVRNHGLAMAGWEDGWIDGHGEPYNTSSFTDGEVLTNAWDNVWEWGAANRAYKMAKGGYKVILSHATHLYFDHPYEPDSEERGLYWAPRFTDTYKTFGYIAGDIYENIDVKRSGETITKAEVCGTDNAGCPTLRKPENILGVQGHVWSETVLTSDLLDYMLFPRLLALAERAWHKPLWEDINDVNQRHEKMSRDWENFAKSLGSKELSRLDSLKVKYRVAPPGARIENNKVFPSVTFPGLPLQYSRDNVRWFSVPDDGIPFLNSSEILLRSRSADGQRTSSVVKVTPVTPLSAADQTTIDYMAENIDIKLTVLDNTAQTEESQQEMVIKNNGDRSIQAQQWDIYFDGIRLLQPNDYPYPEGLLLPGSGLRLYHIGGSQYKITPDALTFKPINPGKQISFRYIAKYWQSARTDFMPNMYVAADGMTPKVIASTAGEALNFVSDFTQPKQWKRYNFDQYDPFLPRTRYTINSDVTDEGVKNNRIIPTPVNTEINNDIRVLISTTDWVVVKSNDFPSEIKWIAETFQLQVVDTKPALRYVQLYRDKVFTTDQQTTSKDSYKVNIDPNTEVITLTANQNSGIFYATKTLYRLSNKVARGREVPSGVVTDGPRYSYRGMHFDVGRNFHSKHEVMKLLDIMSIYKLNKLHFHLSEDEGWRLDIPGLPELTTVGSQRCFDKTETKCILPQLGSGPTTATSGSGFYNVSDYKEILQYAADRYIQVIPEFDMPGHARAAIKAMEARYRQLKVDNMEEAKKYLLTEFSDKSQYISVQWFIDNALNPCLDSTFVFTNHVIREVVKMHQDIQPLEIYHFGGDEVAKGAWVNSSACREFIQRHIGINTVADIKEHFARNISAQAEGYGLHVGAWEDGLMNTDNQPYNPTLLTQNKSVYAYAWDNVWEWGVADRAYKLANAGYKVVLSHATHLYFDHPYEPDPEERGYYWATRYTDTRKTFGYIPDNFYWNADVKRSGEALTKEEICNGPQCLQLNKPENIVGIQGQLWSETVRTDEELDSMIFPRLLALAERAWHKASWENIEDKKSRDAAKLKDWINFANTLGYRDLRYLDSKGVKYRVPPPGGIVNNNGELKVNTAYPGLTVEYSLNSGTTWRNVQNCVKVNNGDTVYLRTRSADSSRYSRVVSFVAKHSSVDSTVSRADNFSSSVLLSMLCILINSLTLL